MKLSPLCVASALCLGTAAHAQTPAPAPAPIVIEQSAAQALEAAAAEQAQRRSQALGQDPAQDFMRRQAVDSDVSAIAHPGNAPTFTPDGNLSEGDPFDPLKYDSLESMQDDLSPDLVTPDGDEVRKEPLPPNEDEVIRAASDGMGLKGKIPALRYNAIQQAGMTLGLRAGLARQSELNNVALEEMSRNLDQQYNFQALLLQGNILPPVIAESKDLFVQGSPDFIQLAGTNYRIVSQARFIYTPPNWRTYLLRKYPYRPASSIVLKPGNLHEKQLWEQAVREGFRRGRIQAHHILREGWQLLKRDHEGMAKYWELLIKGVVSAPYVETAGKDIVGNGSNMTVGIKELRITAMPQLHTQRRDWRPDVGAASPEGYLSNKGEGLGNDEIKPRKLDEIDTGRFRKPSFQPQPQKAPADLGKLFRN